MSSEAVHAAQSMIAGWGLDGSHRPESDYSERVLGSVNKTIGGIHKAIQSARLSGIDAITVENRIFQVTASFQYADTFVRKTDYSIPDRIDDAWITGQLILGNYDERESERAAMISWIADELIRYEGTSEKAGEHLMQEAFTRRNPMRHLKWVFSIIPIPYPHSKRTSGFWKKNIFDGTLPVFIGGLEHSGVTALRRIIRDFRILRQAYCPKTNWTRVSGDSWMFARQENLEKLFGESVESMELEKYFFWSGSVNIAKPESMETDRFLRATSRNRAICASVSALMLKDSHVNDFIMHGAYPDVGSFTMPKVTFQNFVA